MHISWMFNVVCSLSICSSNLLWVHLWDEMLLKLTRIWTSSPQRTFNVSVDMRISTIVEVLIRNMCTHMKASSSKHLMLHSLPTLQRKENALNIIMSPTREPITRHYNVSTFIDTWLMNFQDERDTSLFTRRLYLCLEDIK